MADRPQKRKLKTEYIGDAVKDLLTGASVVTLITGLILFCIWLPEITGISGELLIAYIVHSVIIVPLIGWIGHMVRNF